MGVSSLMTMLTPVSRSPLTSVSYSTYAISFPDSNQSAMVLLRFPMGNLFFEWYLWFSAGTPTGAGTGAPILDPMVHGPNNVAYTTEETTDP